MPSSVLIYLVQELYIFDVLDLILSSACIPYQLKSLTLFSAYIYALPLTVELKPLETLLLRILNEHSQLSAASLLILVSCLVHSSQLVKSYIIACLSILPRCVASKIKRSTSNILFASIDYAQAQFILNLLDMATQHVHFSRFTI